MHEPCPQKNIITTEISMTLGTTTKIPLTLANSMLYSIVADSEVELDGGVAVSKEAHLEELPAAEERPHRRSHSGEAFPGAAEPFQLGAISVCHPDLVEDQHLSIGPPCRKISAPAATTWRRGWATIASTSTTAPKCAPTTIWQPE